MVRRAISVNPFQASAGHPPLNFTYESLNDCLCVRIAGRIRSHWDTEAFDCSFLKVEACKFWSSVHPQLRRRPAWGAPKVTDVYTHSAESFTRSEGRQQCISELFEGCGPERNIRPRDVPAPPINNQVDDWCTKFLWGIIIRNEEDSTARRVDFVNHGRTEGTMSMRVPSGALLSFEILPEALVEFGTLRVVPEHPQGHRLKPLVVQRLLVLAWMSPPELVRHVLLVRFGQVGGTAGKKSPEALHHVLNIDRRDPEIIGRVWAEGSVGEGATFYFSLPDDYRKGELHELVEAHLAG